MDNRLDKSNLNPVQQAAVELIQDDMRFLYSVVMNEKKIMPTYWVELSPYIGLIVDGAEAWIKSYNLYFTASLFIVFSMTRLTAMSKFSNSASISVRFVFFIKYLGVDGPINSIVTNKASTRFVL